MVLIARAGEKGFSDTGVTGVQFCQCVHLASGITAKRENVMLSHVVTTFEKFKPPERSSGRISV